MPIPNAPLRYSPDVEKPEDGEAETQAELIEQLLKISSTTYRDGEGPLRSVHAKSHGVLQATLTVTDLPPELAQGLFAKPGSYDALMRFSTSPGDILPDKVSTPRGLAVRIQNITGDRLPGSEEQTGQDFVLVTGKAFSAHKAKQFLKNLKMLAGTTDKAEGLKIALSAALRATESVVEAVGGESATLKTLGGYPETHILGESFFSQVPIRFGDYITKIGIVPTAPALTELTDKQLDMANEPDALRKAVRAFFAGTSGAWDIRAQLCTNPEDMPIEDAAALWPEDKSPYVTIARLEAPAQDSWSDELRAAIDNCTAFSPWNGLAAHRPLGSIMRVRKAAYEASANFRLSRAGCPVAHD